MNRPVTQFITHELNNLVSESDIIGNSNAKEELRASLQEACKINEPAKLCLLEESNVTDAFVGKTNRQRPQREEEH